MAHELMIPDRAEVPAYILNPDLARQANEEALAGISTGYAARLKLAGKQFALVDGNGNETPYPPAKLVPGPDGNLYLPVVVLRAKKELQKSFYLTAFNPNAEAQAPDCFSNDGVRPDPSATAPQCDLCASCPQNAYGSGKDQQSNPTNGKACADTKILAVFIPNAGVHSFKIPPASLKNWGLYVKQLSNAGIPLGMVKTLVGFEMTVSFPVLVFQFGGWVPQEVTEKLAAMAQTSEVEEIVSAQIKATAKPAAPAVQKPQVAAPVQAPVVDDLGLGLGTPEPPKQTRTRKPKEDNVVQHPAAAPAAPAAVVSDDDLRASLGL